MEPTILPWSLLLTGAITLVVFALFFIGRHETLRIMRKTENFTLEDENRIRGAFNTAFRVLLLATVLLFTIMALSGGGWTSTAPNPLPTPPDPSPSPRRVAPQPQVRDEGRDLQRESFEDLDYFRKNFGVPSLDEDVPNPTPSPTGGESEAPERNPS